MADDSPRRACGASQIVSRGRPARCCRPGCRPLRPRCATFGSRISVELAQADVLNLEDLPVFWGSHDLVVSGPMLEYIPRRRFVEALKGLRSQLDEDGTFFLFFTRRNPLTRGDRVSPSVPGGAYAATGR